MATVSNYTASLGSTTTSVPSSTMSSSTITGADGSTSVVSVSSSASSTTTSIISSSSIISSTTTTSTSPTSTSSTISSTTTILPSSTSTSTSTVSGTSTPTSTQLVTSTSTLSGAEGPSSTSTTTILVTRSASSTPGSSSTHTSTTSTSTGGAVNTQSAQDTTHSSGLSSAGVTAVAVVVPVVVVALLILAGLFLWRKRKQKKVAEEARRKEVEEYGFNPNNDPTLPTVASEGGPDMAEDHSSGYRGWGAATASSRKMSTTLSGGHTHGQLSDVSGAAGLYGAAASSPPNGYANNSDSHSDNPLMGAYNGNGAEHSNRDTMDSDEIGTLGAGPAAANNNSNGIRRGPSNASSRYSHGALSDTSDPPVPPVPGQGYDNYNNGYGAPGQGYGYSQHGPYGDGSYGGAGGPQDTAASGMPIVRDVSARRNTRIQQPGNYSQGNSGIAQNF